MLTFFRRIRRSLLDSGAIRKYLLYAVGEIALVAIGILIALGVNNRNIKRLETKSWHKYSSRLYSDLQQDTTELTYLLFGLNQKKDALHYINDSFLNQSNSSTNPSGLAEKLLQGEKFGWGQFNYSGTTFKDLRNTGNLGLIDDSELRILIEDYYENWELHRGRILQRKSDFPKFVFKTIPIKFNLGGFGDSKQLGNIENLQIKISTELRIELLREIQHELNYTGFVEVVLAEIEAHAIDILNYLESSNLVTHEE